jgi:hypothetical protein
VLVSLNHYEHLSITDPKFPPSAVFFKYYQKCQKENRNQKEPPEYRAYRKESVEVYILKVSSTLGHRLWIRIHFMRILVHPTSLNSEYASDPNLIGGWMVAF